MHALFDDTSSDFASNQPRLEDVNCICNFFVSRSPLSVMVFNGKQETLNGMKLFTNILPGSA